MGGIGRRWAALPPGSRRSLGLPRRRRLREIARSCAAHWAVRARRLVGTPLRRIRSPLGSTGSSRRRRPGGPKGPPKFRGPSGLKGLTRPCRAVPAVPAPPGPAVILTPTLSLIASPGPAGPSRPCRPRPAPPLYLLRRCRSWQCTHLLGIHAIAPHNSRVRRCAPLRDIACNRAGSAPPHRHMAWMMATGHRPGRAGPGTSPGATRAPGRQAKPQRVGPGRPAAVPGPD